MDSLTKWKIWIIDNFEYYPGEEVEISTIIKKSENEKENIGCPLTTCSLGKIINQVWKITAKRVRPKRGSTESTYYKYNNLREKQNRISDDFSKSSINYIDGFQLNGDWTEIRDSLNQATLLHHTNFEFQGRRVVHEICINEEPDEPDSHHVYLKSGPFENHEIAGFPLISKCTLLEKVVNLMKLVESSKSCCGFTCENPEDYSNKVVTGLHRDLSGNSPDENKCFATNCKIFIVNGRLCDNCREVRKHIQRRSRRGLNSSETVHKFCNNRYLTKEKIVKKYLVERNKRINAEAREKLVRENLREQMIVMEAEDHEDLSKIFKEVDKDDIPQEMDLLWTEQLKILKTKSPKGYRWHPKVIRMCLDLYCKNPHVLDSLREFVFLPSQRTIRRYKSKVEQKPGWNPEVLSWCLEEAKKNGLKEHDYWGGLLLDEMRIQENVEMSYSHGKHKLVGFVELGEVHNHMSILSGNSEPECQLAKQVLQFVFLSDRGFRFPIAHFPSADCTPSDLYYLFWEGVKMMYEYNFVIYWCVLDGAEINRQFIKLHFNGDPAHAQFTTHNIYTGEPMVFIVDCKHNFKKIRNNLEKSNEYCKPRCLNLNGKPILWKQLHKAFEWDQANHSLPIHEKLSFQHFQLDPASKMRNSLAEDVLDTKMLLLLEAYRRSLNNDDKAKLDSLITLIKHTSQLVALFSDKLCITHQKDPRLLQLLKCTKFFRDWKEEAGSDDKKLISAKLWFDIQSMSLGFISMIKVKLSNFPSSVIKPAIINQDCVENHFGQIRSCNGQNNNPTYKLQQSCQNSIILGQTVISRKSNTGQSVSACSRQMASLPK